MPRRKPIASLSLDLDNKWSYLKTRGDSRWQSFPTYLDVVVPRVLDFLKQRGMTITVFVVGQDAALQVNYQPLQSIAEAGHEIGNHSFHHEPWLHRYSQEELDADLSAAEMHIERVTGQRPVGFRGPGFSFSEAVLQTLADRGYRYDASTLPTFLGPLARAYYFRTARLTSEEKEQRKELFGSFAEGLRPLKPYLVRPEDGQLLEIPVTTMPIFRIPIHLSYLLYLAGYSRLAAHCYFRTALSLCRVTRVEPSFLLHPLDFLGGDDDGDLAFFPAMKMSGQRKRALAAEFIELLARRFTIVTMREHARLASENVL